MRTIEGPPESLRFTTRNCQVQFPPRLESPIQELRYKTERSKKILQDPIVIALWAEKCPLDLRPDEHIQRMQILPVTSHYFLQKLIIYINSWIPAAHIPPASRAALVATWESQQHMSQRSDLCQKSPAAFAQALTSQRRQQLPQFKRQDLCVRALAFDIMYITTEVNQIKRWHWNWSAGTYRRCVALLGLLAGSALNTKRCPSTPSGAAVAEFVCSVATRASGDAVTR